MIRRYVYYQNIEHLGLIQTVPLSSPHRDSTYAPEDLPYSFPLLLYTAPALANLYKINDAIGRQSFMLSKKLYNSVTNQKSIESDWSYATNDPKSSNQSSIKSKESDKQLDLIEEQYISQTSNKRARTSIFSSSSKSSSSKPSFVDFKNLADQIRSNAPEPQTPSHESSAKN
ncbi:hypothetical protein C2G38_2230399 [Gigaspora rosea]|uniref:Uncharacterized protein n=1 Tax=Gigaspora rosea TaxID=44941 RepID=A0A397U2E5_9GLOM|nr:hypothetical protein C2G38_2230399 [Gigaspora rosea]